MESAAQTTPRQTLAIAEKAFTTHARLHRLDHYTGILAMHGLARMAIQSGDEQILSQCLRAVRPFADGHVQFKCNFPNYQCGGNGTALLLWKGHLPSAEAIVRTYAKQIMQEAPRDSRAVIRMPGAGGELMWIDAAFAVTPFLLFAGLALAEESYVEEAFLQVAGMYEVLRDPANGLLHQSRGFRGAGRISQDHWSRGNGWGLLAAAELAAWLPDNHRLRPQAEQMLVDHLNACLAVQDDHGLWHQELTEPRTSYVETSGTGLILFALGVAIQRDLLPAGCMEKLVLGLNGYSRYITADGSVFHTCTGCLCPGDGSILDYKATPPVLNDPHAFGPVILAFSQAHQLGIHSIGA